MTRDEFNFQMRRLQDSFGSIPTSSHDTWYDTFQKFGSLEYMNAVTSVISSMKKRPCPADLLELLGQAKTGGGSEQIKSNGCDTCGGSGWASVELRRGEMTSMRCMCSRGDALSSRFVQLTNELLSQRRINIIGQVVFKNDAEELREYKLSQMTTPKTIEWAKKGLEQRCIKSF